MTRYTKYNADTGAIEYTFDGRASELHLHDPCIEGEYSAKEYTIVDGAAVRKTQSDIDQADIDRAWIVFRNRRNGYLTDSDWTQSLDSPLSDTKKQEWATYRQQLRDLPSTVDPSNPTWPSKPS